MFRRERSYWLESSHSCLCFSYAVQVVNIFAFTKNVAKCTHTTVILGIFILDLENLNFHISLIKIIRDLFTKYDGFSSRAVQKKQMLWKDKVSKGGAPLLYMRNHLLRNNALVKNTNDNIFFVIIFHWVIKKV